MRGISLLAILSVAIAGMLAPSVASGQQAGQDSVGGGTFTVFQPGAGPLEFFIDAHSGPSGENPGGTWVASPNSPSPTRYSVVCLEVTGNIAVVGVDWIDGNFNSFLRFANASVDTLAVALWDFPLSPDSCRQPPSFIPAVTVIAGDIIVTDVSPLPTAKDECKNGGWRNYGVFKDQGDCVSFVATGGKNPPAKSG
jgi:hypothetical protein